MTTIKATCSRDGEVVLMPHELTLVWCVDAPDSGSWYSFRCPMCGVVNQKPADSHIVELLRHHGVTLIQWAIGTEQTHTFRIDGHPVDEDDLIAFGLRLHARPAGRDPYREHEPKHRREAA